MTTTGWGKKHAVVSAVRWFFAALLCCVPTMAAPEPNMVIFLADDHGYLDSEVYGAKDVRTPNMRRLAAAGMTFTHCFVASPSCAPSRAALLTGLMPARNGAEANHSKPRAELKSFRLFSRNLDTKWQGSGRWRTTITTRIMASITMTSATIQRSFQNSCGNVILPNRCAFSSDRMPRMFHGPQIPFMIQSCSTCRQPTWTPRRLASFERDISVFSRCHALLPGVIPGASAGLQTRLRDRWQRPPVFQG